MHPESQPEPIGNDTIIGLPVRDAEPPSVVSEIIQAARNAIDYREMRHQKVAAFVIHHEQRQLLIHDTSRRDPFTYMNPFTPGNPDLIYGIPCLLAGSEWSCPRDTTLEDLRPAGRYGAT